LRFTYKGSTEAVWTADCEVLQEHLLSEPARGFSVLATDGYQCPPVNFQAGMQQPGILQPAEADSQSIGRRRFTE
jgi:hypothetical protein